MHDWRARISELDASDNPFAVVALAHLAAQDTKGDVPGRERAKLALVRRLYDRGFSREHILSLFRFIDWLLALPEDREQALRRTLRTMEEEGQMPYITSIERLSRAEGREEGREEGQKEGREEGREEERRDLLRHTVVRRFGVIPPDLETRIASADPAVLTDLFDRALVASTIDEI